MNLSGQEWDFSWTPGEEGRLSLLGQGWRSTRQVRLPRGCMRRGRLQPPGPEGNSDTLLLTRGFAKDF